MIIYISGKMTGLPDYGRAVFFEAEKELLKRGYVVLNPAWLPDGLKYDQYMDIDLAMIRQADAICLLPNWEDSRGAKLEKDYARELGLPVYFLHNLTEHSVNTAEVGMAG